MTDIQSSFKLKTKQIIYDGIQKSFEIIVSCHDKNCSPRIEQSSARRHDSISFDYIKVRTKELKNNLHVAYGLDLFLDVDNNKGVRSVLLERWYIHYDLKRKDMKEGRISSVNKHVGILMRTLYCYVRLLPAFQLSTQSTQCPLSFRIYSTEAESRDRFLTDTVSYNFPDIPTQFGHLTLRMQYMHSHSIKSIYDISLPDIESVPAHSEPNGCGRVTTAEDDQEEVIPPARRHSLPARRHSVSTPQPIPIPNSSSNNRDDSPRQTSRGVPVPLAATWGVSSTGHVYSDQLRSPSQPANSLTRSVSPIGEAEGDAGGVELDLPGPPVLSRHQSQSADSAPTLQNRATNMQEQQISSREGKFSGKGDAAGVSGSGSRSRTGSMSKGTGRPPQHPDASSYSSSLGSSPFAGTPAAFYLGGLVGSSFPSSIGDDVTLDVSPPFQIPSIGLLSTSPSTGPGSSLSLLRDQLIGSAGKGMAGRAERYHAAARTARTVAGPSQDEAHPMELMGLAASIGNLLPELPDSPFHNDTLTGAGAYPCLGRESSHTRDRDSGSIGGPGDLGVDADCIFAYDDNDRDSDSVDEARGADDMPFAWAQPQADLFEFGRSSTSQGGPSDRSGSQSFIAQQCMAPPVLSSFNQVSTYGRQSESDVSTAMAKLQKLKEFQMQITR